MVSLLNDQLPTDSIDRVHAFAKDLALWVTENDVKPVFSERRSSDGKKYIVLPIEEKGQKKYGEVLKKWNDSVSFDLLLSFDYVTKETSKLGPEKYILRKKAFDLLSTPATPPLVFISYKQDYSCVFALLVQARLELVGIHTFLDLQIKEGDTLPKVIENKIKECTFFICVLAPETLLKSKIVRQELYLAKKEGRIILPIWHLGFDLDKHIPNGFTYLKDLLAFKVQRENTDSYNHQIEKLINRLGYSTVSRV